jgi:acetyl esterase/lipase
MRSEFSLHFCAPSRLGVSVFLPTVLSLAASFVVAQEPQSPKSKRPPTPAEIVARYQDTVEVRLDQPYAAGGNPFQMVDIYLPKVRKNDRPLPVLAMIHGGGWGGGTRQFFTARACDYASTGDYAVVCIGYRLTREATFPAQIHDCKAAIRWIRGHAQELNLDPDRIGLFGGSAGAHLALLVATSGHVTTLDGDLGDFKNLSSRVACVVNICGPADLTRPICSGRMAETLDGIVAKLLGGPLAEKADVAKAASPVAYVSKETPPILTLHGTKDSLVDFQQSERLDAALKEAGVSSLLIPMVGVDHNFTAGAEPLRRIRQFLDLHLRGIPAEIATTPIPRDEAVAP